MATWITSPFLSRLDIKSFILYSLKFFMAYKAFFISIILFHQHINPERNTWWRFLSSFSRFIHWNTNFIYSFTCLLTHCVSTVYLKLWRAMRKIHGWASHSPCPESLPSLMGKMGMQTDKVQHRCYGQNSYEMSPAYKEGGNSTWG